MQFLLLSLKLAVALPTVTEAPDAAEYDNSVSLVREIDLDSGDSPLFAIEPATGGSLASGVDVGIRSPDRLFRTAPYLRVNEQNKVQLHVPRGEVITVGHVADAGKGNVALCRGWISESWCTVTMHVDELQHHATLELVVPRRNGNLRITFKQVHKAPAIN